MCFFWLFFILSTFLSPAYVLFFCTHKLRVDLGRGRQEPQVTLLVFILAYYIHGYMFTDGHTLAYIMAVWQYKHSYSTWLYLRSHFPCCSCCSLDQVARQLCEPPGHTHFSIRHYYYIPETSNHTHI